MKLEKIIENAINEIQFYGWSEELVDRYRIQIENECKNIFGSSINLISSSFKKQFNNSFSKDRGYKRHIEIPRLGIEKIMPDLRKKLDERIRASADLIVLERKAPIELSLARFSKLLFQAGNNEIKSSPKKFSDLDWIKPHLKSISKPIYQQKEYEQRRRDIDQGHKIIRDFDYTIAEQNDFIAAIWKAHPKTSYYQARPYHWERNNKIYIRQAGWAYTKGYVKKGEMSFFEDIEDPPSYLVNCTCYFDFIYSLSYIKRKYPELITNKEN
jgi:hypothetical protein